MPRNLGRKTFYRDADEMQVQVNSVPAPADVVDHGSLLGLGDYDHLWAVHKDTAGTITAQHQFAPASAQPPFTLGVNAQGQLVNGLRADELAKSVNAGSGLTGGGTLTADVDLNVGAGAGISVAADAVAVNQGYAFTWTAQHIFNAGLRIGSTQQLEFSTDVALRRMGADALGLASGDLMQSSGYTSGISGWAIYDDGTAEFQNVLVRGELHAAVFVKDLIEAHAGTLVVSKSSGVLAADMAPGASGTWLMYINDPPGGGFLFSSGDYCRLKTEYSGGVSDLWFTVASPTDNGDGTQRYTCTWVSGTRNITLPAGSPVVDYGASGAGYVWITADEATSFGYGPNLSIATWASDPSISTNHSLKARLGNMRGSFGAGANVRYGFGVGDYAGGNYLSYNAETANAFVFKAGGGNVQIDGDGILITGGTVGTYSNPNSLRMAYGGLISYLTLNRNGGRQQLNLRGIGDATYNGELYLQAYSSASNEAQIQMLSRTTGSSVMDFRLNGASRMLLTYNGGSPQLLMNADIFLNTGYSISVGRVYQTIYAFSAWRSSNQSIPNNSTTTITGYAAAGTNSACKDDSGIFNETTGVFTVPEDGWYIVQGGLEFAANNTGIRSIQIARASDGAIYAVETDNAPSGSAVTRLTISRIYYLTAGVTVDLRVYQNSGGSLNVNAQASYSPWFSAIRIN